MRMPRTTRKPHARPASNPAPVVAADLIVSLADLEKRRNEREAARLEALNRRFDRALRECNPVPIETSGCR